MKNLILLITLSLSLNTYAGISEAYYEVPTSQADLKASAQFKIQKLSIKNNINNVSTLEYQVPEELTGLINSVEFVGTLNENGGTLSSDHGVLNCLANIDRMMCSVSYQTLDFDSVRAKEIISQKFKGEELGRRLKIQEKFSTDPIGIIHILFSKSYAL